LTLPQNTTLNALAIEAFYDRNTEIARRWKIRNSKLTCLGGLILHLSINWPPYSLVLISEQKDQPMVRTNGLDAERTKAVAVMPERSRDQPQIWTRWTRQPARVCTRRCTM
jgi:hypothetical protein